MKKSTDYLLEALEKVAGKNDKEKAATMKIAQSTLSQYKTGERTMDDFACIMVAKTLGIDPMRIIAAAQEEREKNEERRGVWRDFRQAREQEKGRALVPVMAVLGGLAIATMMALPHLNNLNMDFTYEQIMRTKVSTAHALLMARYGFSVIVRISTMYYPIHRIERQESCNIASWATLMCR